MQWSLCWESLLSTLQVRPPAPRLGIPRMETVRGPSVTTVPGTVDSSRKNEKVLVHFPDDSLSPRSQPLVPQEEGPPHPQRNLSSWISAQGLAAFLASSQHRMDWGQHALGDLSHLPQLVLGCCLGDALTLASMAEYLGMQNLVPGGFRAQPLYLGIVSFLGPCPPGSSFL